MTETIVYTVNVTVANGPRLTLNRAAEVDAFDKFSVTVPAAATGMDVELQPGGAGQVRFLLVTSDVYGNDLSYKVNTEATDYLLDQPHLLTGVGAVSMLAGAPARLIFSNGLSEDAQIQILIGRDATP